MSIYLTLLTDKLAITRDCEKHPSYNKLGCFSFNVSRETLVT